MVCLIEPVLIWERWFDQFIIVILIGAGTGQICKPLSITQGASSVHHNNVIHLALKLITFINRKVNQSLCRSTDICMLKNLKISNFGFLF
jgi:hypothetical protein